jgi:tight adherence protein C
VVLLVIIGLLLVGVGVALLLHGWTFAGGGTAETIGQIKSYGFAGKTVGESDAGPAHSPLTALSARLGGLAGRVLGVGEHGIGKQLLAAGMHDADPLTIVGYRVFGAIGASLLWLWLSAAMGMPVVLIVLGAGAFAVLGWMLPILLLTRRARLRTERIDYELPELIDLLVVTLEAGLSFLASLHMAAARLQGPLGDELRLTLAEQRMGLSINDSLDGMLRRCETPALRTFVRSIIQGESLGVSTGQIMRNLAVEMRKRRRAKAEERAQKAPIKIIFPLVFLIFPAMFIVLLGPIYYSLSKAFGGD